MLHGVAHSIYGVWSEAADIVWNKLFYIKLHNLFLV